MLHLNQKHHKQLRGLIQEAIDLMIVGASMSWCIYLRQVGPTIDLVQKVAAISMFPVYFAGVAPG